MRRYSWRGGLAKRTKASCHAQASSGGLGLGYHHAERRLIGAVDSALDSAFEQTGRLSVSAALEDRVPSEEFHFQLE
jgi:hypothetical protein